MLKPTAEAAPLLLSPMTDTPHTLPDAKREMRGRMTVIRREASLAFGVEAARALAAHAPALGLAEGAVVAGYWPMADEIDPRPLMEALARLGCRLALPEVTARAQPLLFRAWSPGDPLEPGPHGTLHPLHGAPVVEPGALLVPMLAFDARGFRLGYGGGYYDRTLESLRSRAQVRAIGVAFAAQAVAAVPHDGRDQHLDAVVTEDGLIVLEAK